MRTFQPQKLILELNMNGVVSLYFLLTSSNNIKQYRDNKIP